MEIAVVSRQRAHRVGSRPLEAFLRRLVRVQPAAGREGFAVALVSDRAMRDLNRRFRGMDETTDVLSFPDDGPWLGDIVVSVPRAALQAEAGHHTLGKELRTLLVHGYLHLLGYDHETDDGAMMRRQRAILRRLATPRRR